MAKKDKEVKISPKESIADSMNSLSRSFLYVVLGTFIIGAFQSWIVYDIINQYNITSLKNIKWIEAYGILIIIRFIWTDSGLKGFGSPLGWSISVLILSGIFWLWARAFSIMIYLI